MTAGPKPFIRVILPGSPDEVWPFLREPELIRRWFGWDYDGLDTEIEGIFIAGTDHTVHADEANHVLTLSSHDGVRDQFVLQGHGDETTLSVTRARRTDADSWEGIYDDVTRGWMAFVAQLRFSLVEHSGAPRRSIVLGGPMTIEGERSLLDRFGVGDLSDKTGAAYSSPGGPHGLSGVVVAGSSTTGMLTVDGLGPGLAAIQQVVAEDGGPSLAFANLSAYGFTNDEHATESNLWRRWWITAIGPIAGD